MSQEDASTSPEGSVTRVMRHKAVDVEWKIPMFMDLPHKEDQSIKSSTFLLCDAKWFIHIHPDTFRDIALFIVMRRSPRAFRASYSAAVLKADGSVFRSVYGIKVFGKDESVWCSDSFRIPRSELLNHKDVVLPDGTLTVLVSVCFLDETTSLDAACQTATSEDEEPLSEQFRELFLTECEPDTTVNVKSKEFKVHKSVLVARSSVFRAMFQADMIEKNSNHIDIDDCEPDTFHAFLLFLYSGKLDVVTSNNAMGLYLLADKYNFENLKKSCSMYLGHEITVDSVCDIVHFASLHDEHELLEAATEFFLNNSRAIIQTAKWMSFFVENSTVANELFLKMSMKLELLSKNI